MEWFIAYAGIGAAVGFFAGLLGIGGGAIMVPMLVWALGAQGIPKEHVLHLAVGTAMATILFTSMSSVRSHMKRGPLRWDIVRGMTPGILVGGLAGSVLAGIIPTRVFALIFVATVYAAATNILLDHKPNPARPLPGGLGLFAAGFTISAVSAFAAIGGAFMTIPFLLLCNVPMLGAIGAAAAIGFPISIAGTVGFVASGLHEGGLPAWSLGYVYLPALAGIVVASMLMAPVGVAVAHRVPVRVLKRVFALLLFAFATRMLVSFW